MLMNTLSQHALIRASQRNISNEDMQIVLTYGQRLHNGGAILYFLGQRDIPEELKSDDRIMKLEGTTLVISKDGTCLITLYKNKDGLKKLKKKRKWTLPSSEAA